MSGAFPTSPAFRALNFRNVRPTIVDHSLSGKRVVRQIGSQYFTFEVVMPPMVYADAMDVFAFLQKQKGSFETFTITYPTDNRGAGKAETDILVNGTHAVSDSTIALDGFAASTTGVLKAGDLIKFAHSKVYMVQDDVDSNSSGEITVSIEPSLVTALADNSAVTVNKPSITVYLTSEEIMYTTDASGLYNIQFEVREVIT